jgi:hypothetical protein
LIFFDDRIFGSRVHPQFLFDCSSRNNRDSQIIMAGASTRDEILDISDMLLMMVLPNMKHCLDSLVVLW